MRLGRVALTLEAASGCFVACSGQTPPPPPWQLVWSDEFDEPAVDATKWKIDVGDNAQFGTGQVDYDTANPQNVSVSGGYLSLTAQEGNYEGDSYTSGRIETGGLFAQEYGRFEASIQIPRGEGMWPAFWLLGANDSIVGWPQCGEIDIMENHGADPTTIAGSLHGPLGQTDYTYTQGFQLPGGASFSTAFHQFAVEWEPGVVRWYVDGALYETQSADLFPQTQAWVFNQPFFLILDLAVGGQFGPVGASTSFPQSMRVDYVHVYARPGESSFAYPDAGAD